MNKNPGGDSMTIEVNQKFQPGTLVNCRRRLWRVDYQEGNILYVTSVNESTNQTRLYLLSKS